MPEKETKTPRRMGKPVQIWLDDKETRMLEQIMEAETRNISDTLRHSLTTYFCQHYPDRHQPCQDRR